MNTSRTLEQLEAVPWPAASADSSSMVQRCHALRKMPLEELSPGDCRLLIGQDVGTKYVVPLALKFLEAEPLVEGDYYAGDLLLALFRLQTAYWSGNQEEFKQLLTVAKLASEQLSAIEEPFGSDVKLGKEVNAFIKQHDA
ncbi:MAG: hypothetical protein KIS62_10895 [Ramlibacter sp.]|nr:hypothetical protein [Ramlibacter sp.]